MSAHQGQSDDPRPITSNTEENYNPESEIDSALTDSAFEFLLCFTSLATLSNLASAPPFSLLQDPPLVPSIVLFIVFPQLLIRLKFLLFVLLSIVSSFSSQSRATRV